METAAPSVTIRPLGEIDLPEAERIFRLANEPGYSRAGVFVLDDWR